MEPAGYKGIEMTSKSTEEVARQLLPEWEDNAVDIALQAISSPSHKEHIFEHLHVYFTIFILDSVGFDLYRPFF